MAGFYATRRSLHAPNRNLIICRTATTKLYHYRLIRACERFSIPCFVKSSANTCRKTCRGIICQPARCAAVIQPQTPPASLSSSCPARVAAIVWALPLTPGQEIARGHWVCGRIPAKLTRRRNVHVRLEGVICGGFVCAETSSRAILSKHPGYPMYRVTQSTVKAARFKSSQEAPG